MKRIFLLFLLVLSGLILVTQPVLADPWFVGNERTDAYGAKANIQVPYSHTLYSGLIATWVGTTNSGNNSWAETGWAIIYGDDPHYFAEYMFYGSQTLYWGGQLSEGDNSSYRTEYVDGGWRTYYNDQLEGAWSGGGLPTPPTQMRAWAEVQGSSSNQLWAIFSNTSWKDSYGSWNYFDQNNLRQDSPYVTAYSTYYYYICYGP